MKTRNGMAKVLADPRYRKRIERKRKGKASYIRTIKHKNRGPIQGRDFHFGGMTPSIRYTTGVKATLSA